MKNCCTSRLGQKSKKLKFVSCFLEELKTKEGCNLGHGLSAAIKVGSLYKTVGGSLFALWCVLSSPFFGKNCIT